MNRKLTRLKHAAILLAGICATSIPAAASADWIITGTLVGIFESSLSINNSGQVAGSVALPYGTGYVTHAFVTGPNGVGMTDFGTLGGYNSMAYGINDSGQVAGFSELAGGSFHAFITGANGVGVTDLGTPLPGIWYASAAYGINNSGQVAGFFTVPGGGHAFITGANGVGMTDLGALGGNGGSGAIAINNFGQVAGDTSIAGSGFLHAFITGPNGVGMIDLGALDGMDSRASDINDSGQVVGGSSAHAFITGANGAGMIDLGTLGGTISGATGINNSGQVVGFSYTADNTPHSFLYRNGVMTDLDLLAPVIAAGWSGLVASDINDLGQIVGYGIRNGAQQMFLLQDIPTSAVPEPETYTMLLVGLALLCFTARRRKQGA